MRGCIVPTSMMATTFLVFVKILLAFGGCDGENFVFVDKLSAIRYMSDRV